MVSKGPSHGVRQVWPGPDMMPTVDVDKEGDEDETGDVQVAVWRGLFAKRRRELVTPQSWVVWFSMLNSGQPWYGTLEGDGNRIRLKVK